MHDLFDYMLEHVEPELESLKGEALTIDTWHKLINKIHTHFNAMRAVGIISEYDFVIGNELSDAMFEVKRPDIKIAFLYIHFRNQELLTNFNVYRL